MTPKYFSDLCRRLQTRIANLESKGAAAGSSAPPASLSAAWSLDGNANDIDFSDVDAFTLGVNTFDINAVQSVDIGGVGSGGGEGKTYIRAQQEMYFITPTVVATTATVGMTLGLTNVNGLCEWQLGLIRESANTFSLRNGASAQSLNVFNTYTDASNYERGGFRWSGNVLLVGAEALGTGSLRSTRLQGNVIELGARMLPTTDGTLDIGATGNRVRNVHVKSAVQLQTKASAIVDGDVAAAADGMIGGVDTTAHRLYVRSGGVWKYATLT